jgi:hypothetical protein
VAETQNTERSPLQSDRGKTTINDAVVVSIAGAVVREVSGAEPEIGGRGKTCRAPTRQRSASSLAGSPAARGAHAKYPLMLARRRRPSTSR